MRLGRFELRWLRFLGPVVILVVWQLAALYVRTHFEHSAYVLPGIDYIVTESYPGLSAFWGGGLDVNAEGGNIPSTYLLATRVLAKHSMITLGRVLGGTTAGMLIGISLGLLMGWSASAQHLLWPPIQALRQVPLLALSILFILWFGGNERGIYIYVAYGVAVMVVVNTMSAIQNVPAVYHQFAQTLGASRLQIYRTVVIPAITPELIGGIRVALGLAWAITVAAEYLAAQGGLGRMLLLSEYFLFTGRMVVVTGLFLFWGLMVNALFNAGARRLIRWAPKLE